MRLTQPVLVLLLAGCVAPEKPTTTIAGLSQTLATGRFNTEYNEEGQLTKCEVTRSTGDAELDRSFCEIVRACSTVTAPPLGTSGNLCMDRKQAEVFQRIVAERNGK